MKMNNNNIQCIQTEYSGPSADEYVQKENV